MSTKPLTNEDITSAIGCVFAVFTIPVSIILWGQVSLDFYRWFIVPIFASAPALTLVHMIGIRWFIGTFTVKIPAQKADDKLKYGMGERATIGLLLACLTWGSGWILHKIIG